MSGLNAKEDAKRAKTKKCWFEFQACISEASGNTEKIDLIRNNLINVRKYMKELDEFGNPSKTDNNIEEFLGSKVVEEITILPPN